MLKNMNNRDKVFNNEVVNTLIDKGFIEKYNELAGLLFERTVDAKFNNQVDFKELSLIDSKYIDNIKDTLKDLNFDKYTKKLFYSLKKAVNKVNKGIQKKKINDLIKGYDVLQNIFNLLHMTLKNQMC